MKIFFYAIFWTFVLMVSLPIALFCWKDYLKRLGDWHDEYQRLLSTLCTRIGNLSAEVSKQQTREGYPDCPFIEDSMNATDTVLPESAEAR